VALGGIFFDYRPSEILYKGQDPVWPQLPALPAAPEMGQLSVGSLRQRFLPTKAQIFENANPGLIGDATPFIARRL